jgi:hypothetical protein
LQTKWKFIGSSERKTAGKEKPKTFLLKKKDSRLEALLSVAPNQETKVGLFPEEKKINGSHKNNGTRINH